MEDVWSQKSKLPTMWHGDAPADRLPADVSLSPQQDELRPIRRVRSPSRPRAWLSSPYKLKYKERIHKACFPRNPPYKPGPGGQRPYHPGYRAYLERRHHFHPKPHHSAQKDREREKEKEKEKGARYERRGSDERGSPPKHGNATRPFQPRSSSGSSSSRDKDTQQGDKYRNQSREGDHRATKSKEKEQSREREFPLSGSQTTKRDQAILKKRKEIDEVYYQECETFGLVTKMLIEKEPSLERLIQSSLQENLRDIGKRCVDAMEKFIEEYDSLH